MSLSTHDGKYRQNLYKGVRRQALMGHRKMLRLPLVFYTYIYGSSLANQLLIDTVNVIINEVYKHCRSLI